jgi:hypothetical protein
MKELNLEELNRIQKKASENAIRLNKALGLPYLVVRNNKLIHIDQNGIEKVIGKPEFGIRKVKKRKITLKTGE